MAGIGWQELVVIVMMFAIPAFFVALIFAGLMLYRKSTGRGAGQAWQSPINRDAASTGAQNPHPNPVPNQKWMPTANPGSPTAASADADCGANGDERCRKPRSSSPTG